MRVDDFDFELPPAAIATEPAEPRDMARLMVFDRATDALVHSRFRDLTQHLRAGDLLVLNDTRVEPWRLRGRRATGGRVECLILQREGARCVGFVKPGKKLEPGDEIDMEDGAMQLRLLERLAEGRWSFELLADDVDAALAARGRAPLPPYIPRDGEEDVARDRERYQTVFAARPGAVAAPTAGLHFTEDLLQRLRDGGVETAHVTLHVGEGTFAPIRVDNVEEHRMHSERFELPEATALAVQRARQHGGRVVAVGTTSCRTLETCAAERGLVEARQGSSDLFLYPGRRFRVVDALITNFHLPRSTLLMLVAAFAGREPVLRAYREAVGAGYRFYSFGDAMLIQ